MKILKKNQNNAERVLRFIIAMFLIPAPLILGFTTYSIVLISISGILFFNALTGTCMIYKIMGIDTCKI